MQTYLNFRLLNLGDHFILASGRIQEVHAIYRKIEPVKGTRGTYNAQCHFTGELTTMLDNTLVIAVMMPEWALRERLETQG